MTVGCHRVRKIDAVAYLKRLPVQHGYDERVHMHRVYYKYPSGEQKELE